jgi:uncharacterized protein (TIGR02391 family)
MPSKKSHPEPPIESRLFVSVDEIDRGIKKLERRINDLDNLNVNAAILTDSGEDDVLRSNIRETIREVFGDNSPEFREHRYLNIWAGPMMMGMSKPEVVAGTERGRTQTRGILKGLVARLQEKREELEEQDDSGPQTYFSRLNLHPRIADVVNELYRDGYHWEAVFAGAKALVNYVKEKSGRHDLDGAPLMRTVFSKNGPLLAFNKLGDQTELDEQEGMMHLFEGAVLGIRNPGGHSFPEGSEQRALEYIQLLSLLAYRVQEARRPS